MGEGRKNMAKIEVVKQHDLKDCGACALQCIIKYYNGYVPLEKIREDTLTNMNGTTAYHLVAAANLYGFESVGFKVDNIHDENIYLPCIAHIVLKNGLQHFLVVYKISKDYIWLMDPAQGKVKMKLAAFLTVWDNILILLTPKSEEIICYQKELTIISVLTNLLSKNKLIFLIILVNIIFIAVTIIGNFYFQIAINSIQQQTDLNFLKFIVFLFLFLTIIKVIMSYLKNYYLCYLNKNLDVAVFTEFLSHIFHLPLKFIQNRSTGEITSRVSELNEVKNLISEIFTSVILNSILIIGAIVVLYLISAKLFLVLCSIISIYLIIGFIVNKILYNKLKENIETSTDFNAELVENIEMNTSIKNLNLIDEFLWKLENKLILMLKSNFKLQKFFTGIEFLKNIVYEVGLFLITTFGIYLIYKGELELLKFITFNSIILYLFEPIKELLELIPKYNYLKVTFNKLSEFINIKTQNNTDGLEVLEEAHISVNKLSYSYNRFKDIISDLSFSIEPGEKILLKGPSGSGKSSLCKLLFRSLEGYSGNINFNNTSEKDYSLNAIRNNILYVGQNEKLFTGTIRDNIICFRNITEEDFLKVTNICQIDEIVSKKPNRYNSVINASLNNLSGGEKQRIILARALLKKANILILDEALSEVNIQMEREILNKIFENYTTKTLIYVSHKDVSNMFPKVIEIGSSK